MRNGRILYNYRYQCHVEKGIAIMTDEIMPDAKWEYGDSDPSGWKEYLGIPPVDVFMSEVRKTAHPTEDVECEIVEPKQLPEASINNPILQTHYL